MALDDRNDNRKWIVLSAIVLKIIMDGLDGSMLNIALPTISQSLGVTSSAIIWIVSAYSITLSTLVLFFGRLGDIVGKSKFFSDRRRDLYAEHGGQRFG
jgi:MFS family permease